MEAPIHIIKYRKVKAKGKESYQLVFNQTPFYPEGGGQVGDTGMISNVNERLEIVDTKKENNLIIHFATSLPENVEAGFTASVDTTKRKLTESNHSATHLLHAALRSVLGTHVQQKGSLVNADYLRFDFSHFSKVTDEEIKQIETLVSNAIKENIRLEEDRAATMEKAQEMGAMAVFGEKYGDKVRIVKFGDSVELCGGTHVQSTGEIGLFKLKSESAVAAGIRRVEAITSDAVEAFYAQQEEKYDAINELLKNPKDIVKSVDDLIQKNSLLQKQIEQFKKDQARLVKTELKAKVEQKEGYSYLEAELNLDAGSVKDILFQLKSEFPNFVGIIGSKEDDKCAVSVIIDEELSKAKNWNAGAIVKAVAQHIQGGGGGQAFYATAGGKNPAGIQKALSEARNLLK
jgi:alanyl-tRNA synthetase